MRSALPLRPPSSKLLEYLRIQSDVCFFNPSTNLAIDHHARKSKTTCTSLKSRCLSTTLPRRATLEAGFLNLESFMPRSKPATPSKLHANESSKTKKIASLTASRNASTGAKKWNQKWYKKLWGPLSAKGGQPLQHDDLPSSYGHEDRHDTSMLGLGRHISAKAAAQPKLRCTELDENGNVILTSGEFKKSELIAKYGLLPRDLRKIDSSLLPHILVRPSAILINLLHLRVLIKSNRVLVFDAYGTTDSYNQSAFMYDLGDKLRQKQNSLLAGGLPYEFRALEAILISVVTSLETEFEGVRQPVTQVLRELEEDIDRDKLRMLLIYSKKLGTFEQKAKLVRDAIDELLEADDDLAAMYLTEKTHDLQREEDDHTEVEMLLESYHKLCDEIVQESGNLVSSIRNTEEIVKAILDANRNSLMVLDLKFSIGTLGMGSGAFIAALFGMNLKNFMEDSDLGFIGVTGVGIILSALVCTYGLNKLRKVQRVRMWGEGGRRGRNWRNEDLDRALVMREMEVERAKVLDRHRKSGRNGNDEEVKKVAAKPKQEVKVAVGAERKDV